MGTRELGQVRHDLKNVMSAFTMGCRLIERRLQPGGDPVVLGFLEEMQAEATKGVAALERLKQLERSQQGPSS